MSLNKSKNEFRVVNVGYLNSAPYRTLSQIDGISYAEANPAECARMLHEEECDLALIPLAEFFGFGGYNFLPFGIGAKDAVESVCLLSQEPLEKLEAIFIDETSQTSVMLLRILLQELNPKLAAKIRLHRLPAKRASELAAHKAGVLVIGDLALSLVAKYTYCYDLAEHWKQLTGLPFVFAVWAGQRKNLERPEIRAITEALVQADENRVVYARAWADEQNMNREDAENYVLNRISYRLDEELLKGAFEFQTRVNRLGYFAELESSRSPSFISRSRQSFHLLGSHLPRSIDAILSDASLGIRISSVEAISLATKASLADLGMASDIRRKNIHAAPGVSYIIDRNINYTNVCNVYCRFCAFYRPPIKNGPREKNGGYLLSKEEIGRKIQETVDAGGIQILLQGGLNPELNIDYYEDLFRWIKANYPVNLHALSADEILHITEISNLTLDEVFDRLIAAGLGSLPGGGAEILVDKVRYRIARLKSKANHWLEVHRTAHRKGLSSTCTMMFGVQESWRDRLNHLYKLRQLQDETRGFTAFITWPFQDQNTNVKRGDTSSGEYLKVQAISRLFLDNITNIQSSWVTMGPSVGQVALYFGANDFGSVMFEENVVSSAGTTFSMDSDLIQRHIQDAGFFPWKRDVHYQPVS